MRMELERLLSSAFNRGGALCGAVCMKGPLLSYYGYRISVLKARFVVAVILKPHLIYVKQYN